MNRIRPKRVTFLAILVLILAVLNGIRVGETVFFWRILIEFEGSPLYTLLSGAIWLLTGLLLVWGLWKGKPWSWAAALGFFLAYPVWYWLDRLLLQRPHANWPFTIILTVVFLAMVLPILFSRRAKYYLQ